MEDLNKKNIQITFDLKIIKKIIISLCLSIVLLFAIQHIGEVYEDSPSEFNKIYPCEILKDGSYNFLYNSFDNNSENQTRCGTVFTKLIFKNPISKKVYSTREAFHYLVIFPPNSTSGYTANESEYEKYKNDIKKSKSYENKFIQLYLPSLIDHPLHILILAVLIYFFIWLVTKFKFNLKFK